MDNAGRLRPFSSEKMEEIIDVGRPDDPLPSTRAAPTWSALATAAACWSPCIRSSPVGLIALTTAADGRAAAAPGECHDFAMGRDAPPMPELAGMMSAEDVAGAVMRHPARSHRILE